MILSAAASHRVLIDHPQAGRSLARIQNARLGARYGFHELASQRRNPAHALQKVEDDAFTGKNHPRVVADHRDRLSLVQAHPVENLGMRRHLVVGGNGTVERGIHIENARHAPDAGQNAVLLGHDRRGRPLVGVDAGIAGGIARRPIFDQRVFQHCGKAS